MSDLTAPQPMLPLEPPGLGQWIVWAALASLLLHAGVLTFLLWQPLPPSAEAEQPPAIDVELVLPPEAASEPPTVEGEPVAEEPAAEPPPAEETTEEAPAEVVAPEASPVEEAQAGQTDATPPAAETAAAEPSPVGQAAAPAASGPETAQPAAPAEAETAGTAAQAAAVETPPAAEAAASAEAGPQQDLVVAGKIAPIPLARPRVRGLTAQSGTAEEGALPPESVDIAEGAVTAATPEEPDVATLELGVQRSAERFYLEAMLSTPSLAAARDMLTTLPPEKRLAQTCNIEALAQIGNAGEGFTPDVVMAEAYALSEVVGTRLVANGAIFRSGEKWYGFAFDCTLSDDLTTVTGFSYRLGTDVTEAVLARLEGN